MYESSKVFPYVYQGIHKETKSLYYGYREANIIPSNFDLMEYRTSSKTVDDLGFDNFDWFVIAEFYGENAGQQAYDFEQECIKNEWGNPLLLNKHYWDINSGIPRFRKNGPMSEETKEKLRKPKPQYFVESLRQRRYSDESRKKMSAWVRTAETRKKISESRIGKSNGPMSDQQKEKISDTMTGKPKTKEHAKNISIGKTGKKQSRDSVETRAEKISKNFEIVYPIDGTKLPDYNNTRIEVIKNIEKFCRDNPELGLWAANLTRVAQGKQKSGHYKGFQCRFLTEVEAAEKK